MTGIFLRVKRDGKFQNLEVEYLTLEELQHVFRDRPTDELINWIAALTSTIREVESLFEKDPNESSN